MNSSAFSIDGPKNNNQDRYLAPVATLDGWVAAIADGVGGKPGGEIAAAAAVAAARQSANDTTWDGASVFFKACQDIREAETLHGLAQTATTL